MATGAERSNLDSILRAARTLRAESEERLAKLRALSSSAAEQNRLVSARGVALASFGPVDFRRLQVQGLPDETVGEALGAYGPVHFMTGPTEDGRYESTLRLASLPEKRWTSGPWAEEREAERAAADSALAELVCVQPRLIAALGLPDDDETGEAPALSVEEGEELEIVVRNREGWVCCRAAGAPDEREGEPAWLPAALVVELAAVVADHSVDEEEEALSVQRGELVEVVSRHYSGWFFCRAWHGVEHAASARRSGWICNRYLEGCESDTGDIQDLASEALSGLVTEASNLEKMVSSVCGQGAVRQPLAQYTENCLSLASSLAEELDAISRAVADSQAHDIRPGTVAAARCGAEAAEGGQLSFQTGDQLLVLHVDPSGWMWCRKGGGDGQGQAEDGWVPRGSLNGQQAWHAEPDLPVPSTTPPPSTRSPSVAPTPPSSQRTPGLAMSRPVCAICMERLSPTDDGHALPCAHTFHSHCLGSWLREKAECPLCRAPAGPVDHHCPPAQEIQNPRRQQQQQPQRREQPEQPPHQQQQQAQQASSQRPQSRRRTLSRTRLLVARSTRPRSASASILRGIFAGMSAQAATVRS